jgi:hypothetical protein
MSDPVRWIEYVRWENIQEEGYARRWQRVDRNNHTQGIGVTTEAGQLVDFDAGALPTGSRIIVSIPASDEGETE